MMPNLRAVVARSIGCRNISSTAARRRSNGRSTNDSKMGVAAGRFAMTGQTNEYQKFLDTKMRSTVTDIVVFWTTAGSTSYFALAVYREIRTSRQRREESRLIEQREEQVGARWKELLKSQAN